MANHKFILSGRFSVALVILLAIAVALPTALPVLAQDVIVPDDAISRELTVMNDPDALTGPTDAVSREFTVLNDLDKPELTDAISREMTTLNRWLADFRAMPDGDPISIIGSEGLGVSAVFPDCIYVQSVRRYIGIKVTGRTAAVGDRVNIEGTLYTDANGNRYIAAKSLTRVSSLEIRPFATTVHNTACGPAVWNPDTGSGQRGVTGGSGACLVSVYLRLAGKVVRGPNGEFAIDDGSDKITPFTLPPGANSPVLGQMVTVNGVLSLVKAEEDYRPLLRVGSKADIDVMTLEK